MRISCYYNRQVLLWLLLQVFSRLSRLPVSMTLIHIQYALLNKNIAKVAMENAMCAHRQCPDNVYTLLTGILLKKNSIYAKEPEKVGNTFFLLQNSKCLALKQLFLVCRYVTLNEYWILDISYT